MEKKKIMPGAEPVYTLGSEQGVLLLHGFSGSPYEMKELGEEFQKKGFSVSLPLLAGHGSSVKDLEKCKWYDWFEDAKNALFDLRKRCKSIVVIGLSTGRLWRCTLRLTTRWKAWWHSHRHLS